jgi:serine/threonine-protein kinase RsbW
VISAFRIECEMRAALPATLEAAEELLGEVRRWSNVVESAIGFAAELLVREALTNAVVHGCHADPARQVRCLMRLKNRRLLIVVGDEGDGFDWRAASGNMAAFPKCSGRGIAILRQYASRVRYNSRGNLVTILQRF